MPSNHVRSNSIVHRLTVAEETLRTIDAQLQMAVDLAGLGIVSIDYAADTSTPDATAAVLFGLEPGVPVPRSIIHSRFHPDDHAQVLRLMQRSLDPTGDGTFVMDHRVVRPDGSTKWLSVKKQIVFADVAGIRRPLSGVLVAMDITERKQAEQARHEVERNYRALAAASSEIAYRMSADWATLLPIDGRQLLASSDQPLADWTWLDLNIPQSEHSRIKQAISEAIAHKALFELEHRIRRPDGSIGWVYSRAMPICDEKNELIAWFGAASDITQRKQSEQILAERTQLLNGILEGTTDVIFAKDLNGRLVVVNGACAAIANSTVEQLTGLMTEEMFAPDVAIAIRQHDKAVIAAKSPLEIEEIIPVSGESRTFLTLKAPLRDVDGRVVGVLGISRDITERKQAEAQLRLSEARFRAAINAVSDIVWTNNAQGQMVGEQIAWGHFTGQDYGSYQGYGWSSAVHPDDAQPTIDAWNEAVAEKKKFAFEHRVRRHDGQWRLCTVRAVPVLNEHGDISEWVGVHNDITDQMSAEAVLRVSEERRRLALEAAELGTWHVVDLETRRTQTDERFRAIFGTTDEWMDYQKVFAVIHPDDIAAIEVAVAAATRAKNPERYAIEYRIFRPDGVMRWVFANGRATFEERASGRRAISLDGTVLDITARKQSELALRESEARLGGILRQSPAGIVQTDAAGCMTLVNPRWCEMLGLSEDELLGRNILDITHPSSVAPSTTALEQLAAGGPDFQIEKTFVRKDSSLLHAQSNVAAVRSPSGEFRGLIAVILDISERLRSEEELHRLAAALYEADRRKGEFLATLAHELRNPLAPIRNGLQLMRRAPANHDVVERTLDMMERQVGQLVHLIDDLMDLSRINAGKIVLLKAKLRVSDVIQDAVDTSRPQIDMRQHTLVLDMPAEPVWIDADRTRLVQIFANLLNNAAKYTKPGGRIRVAVQRHASDVEVAIEDNGVGIAPDLLTRVFDMFAQVNSSLQNSQGGLGIGLSITRRLAEMHGGSITATSGGDGMGSRFAVRLPAALNGPTDMPHQHNHAAKAQAQPEQRRILVVDDNRDGAFSLAEMLDMMGHKTQTAFDGEQAVSMAETFQPDIVLMDIGMPKLNGYEACRLIRAQPWGKSVIIVAQTGWGQDDDKRKAQEAGFDFHIVKPIDCAALDKILADWQETVVASTLMARQDLV